MTTHRSMILDFLEENKQMLTEFTLHFSSPENINSLLNVLENSTRLRKLELTSFELTEDILSKLAINKSLRTLIVKRCEIDDAGAEILAANTTLHTLDISENKITNRGAIALSANKSLRDLNASSNSLGLTGITAFLSNQTLTNLDLSGNNRDNDKNVEDAIKKVQAHIERKSTIFNFNSSCNFFNPHLPDPDHTNQETYQSDVIIQCENYSNPEP